MGRLYNHFVFDENQRYIYPTSDWGFKYLLGSEEYKDLGTGTDIIAKATGLSAEAIGAL